MYKEIIDLIKDAPEHIRDKLEQLVALREYGCYRIPCTECAYLVRNGIRNGVHTCKREDIVRSLNPVYKDYIDAVDDIYYKHRNDAKEEKQMNTRCSCYDLEDARKIIKDLEKSNRNWRRKCQRLRAQLKQQKGAK